jgi:hypothetical protein
MSDSFLFSIASDARHAAVVRGLAALALGAALSGCVVAPVQPAYADGEAVAVAPPPPQYEAAGVAPAPGYVWINGYWGWGGGRHVWTPGRWAAPRSGYGYMPHAWVREGRGWRQRPGYWQRR